jgi:1-acyl-sn-glycerol-3-phosphate acyltransferase
VAAMLQRIAQSILRITGWAIDGEIPVVDKAIIIGGIHTSNWDAFWMLTCKTANNLDVRFLAKHNLIWWPIGPVQRYFGAVPLDRGQSAATVQNLVDLFESKDRLFLALAPEGTRKWQPYWKTGFFRIANSAAIPIVPASIDYARRRVCIGPLVAADDVDSVLKEVRDFYRDTTPRHPRLRGPIVFPPD